jgi:hypothetical protein
LGFFTIFLSSGSPDVASGYFLRVIVFFFGLEKGMALIKSSHIRAIETYESCFGWLDSPQFDFYSIA